MNDPLKRRPRAFAGPKRTKYLAQPTDYRGVRYASKAEARRAAELDLCVKAGTVRWWLRQVPVHLTDDGAKYVVDFLVGNTIGSVHAEDVKGAETTAFRRHKRAWAKAGPFELHVIKGGRVVEIVEGREVPR